MKVQIERATLGKEPEEGLTLAGQMKVDLWLAENKYKKNDEGGWDQETFWWAFTAYGNTAEKVLKYELHKGDSITITDGEATTRTTGEKDDRKTYTNYILRRFEKLSRPEKDETDDRDHE